MLLLKKLSTPKIVLEKDDTCKMLQEAKNNCTSKGEIIACTLQRINKIESLYRNRGPFNDCLLYEKR